MGEGASVARLAELCGVLSLASDLAVGQRLESGIRTTLLASRLADELGLSETEQADVYYLSLLRMAGCTATPELADTMGDLRALGARFDEAAADFGDRRRAMPLMLRHLTEGHSAVTKVRNVGRALSLRPSVMREGHRSHCEVAKVLGERLGASPGVLHALDFTYERWDGTGTPDGRAGEDLPIESRVATAAYHAEMLYRLGGPDGARTAMNDRAGRAVDPGIAAVLDRRAADVFSILDGDAPWAALLDAEPGPHRLADAGAVDEAAVALGDFSEALGWMKGHGRRVASLADAAARSLDLSPGDVDAARRAGQLHDIGNVAVSIVSLDKAGPLGELEWDHVRLHAYQSEQLVARAEPLRAPARIAGMHHERPDGSGYHRQLGAQGVPMAARVVAAADVYDAMVCRRPHRPAVAAELAAVELEAMGRSGSLDATAVSSVLASAGHRVQPRSTVWPLGLTDREVDVLRSVGSGLSIKQAAQALCVSPKTIDTHLQRIYPKLGVSTRAAATLRAVEHGLLDPASD
jgi:HD-GYP domain-containing protein (c-di-GMP phosphodiesterase class II)/DNA-binding CsgD family transcriptional regulator